MVVPDLTLAAEDGPFGVAVSGGGDSLALLLLAIASGADLRVATVDHGLRPAARAEAQFVARICAERGLRHDTLTLTLDDGPALQSRARAARYEALAAWAQANGITSVLLGHTSDDVAETFLMRLADGAGLDGLSQMSDRFARHDITFLRPLLGRSRAHLRDLLAEAGIQPMEDPSNEDPRFERVRVRGLLRDLGISSQAIAASAKALRDARDSVERRTEQLTLDHVTLDRGDWVISGAAWTALERDDPEQARRLLMAAMRAISSAEYPPRRAEQTELLRRLKQGEAATLGGCQFSVARGLVRVTREPAAAYAAKDAAIGDLWDGRWRLDGPARGVVRALGEAVKDTPWRETGLPRRSLMASPAVWEGDTLLAAPVAGHPEGWSARLQTDR